MTAVTTHTGRPAAEAVQSASAAQRADLAEIGEISVHLAALERTVVPAAAARLPDGKAQAEELRRRGRELATALHWLERRLTGDARLARWPAHALSDAARAAAAGHARSERAVVDALSPALDDREIAELARSYRETALVAPTRPHPWLSFRGFTGWIAFKLAARLDGVRDGLDNRSPDGVRAGAADAVRHLGRPAAAAPPYVLRSPAVAGAGGPVPVQQSRSPEGQTS